MHEDLLERADELITEIMARVQDDMLRKDAEIASLRDALEAAPVPKMYRYTRGNLTDYEEWYGFVRQRALGLGEGEGE